LPARRGFYSIVALSGRETLKRIQEVGEDPSRLNAVVLTHEHGDHARGLAALAKSLDIQVYVSTSTLSRL
jgi:metal-dependent hydrolase (beta-lactamase superfamily II)